jgi:sec-independent protein translocase protein TatA
MYTGTLLEFLNMGGGEVMLILAVVLLLFGGKKLPELARGLGKGIRDFKDASEGVKREIHRNINAVDIDEDIRRENPKTNTEVKSDLPRETPIENVTGAGHLESSEPSNKI